MLAQAVRRSGKVTLAVRSWSGPAGRVQETGSPIDLVRTNARFAHINADYNYQGAVWVLPRSGPFESRQIPSMSAALAVRDEGNQGSYRLDYSLDISTVPTINSADILSGKFHPEQIRGKTILIGTNSRIIGDQMFIPGVGMMGGAFVQIVGAETLLAGTPIGLGWLACFAAVALIVAFVACQKPGLRQNLAFGTLLGTLLIAPIPLEAHLISVDVVPALFVVITVWGILVWRRYSRGGITNSVSGLPNLTALQLHRGGREQALVAARILNFAEVTETLPPEGEQALVEQVVSRLSIGSNDKIIYQGDGGIFGWFEEARLPFGHHIDALHALFRNSVKIGAQQVDLAVAFGVEIGSGRSLANRLASALAAADEAAHDGLRWKVHDPEKLQNASWRLSILSQLDHAIDEGQVWVAYQPKLDLKCRKIIGAEALARWTHPEKGPIAATEFIPAAEQNDRIGKLTDFVLENAIASAAKINASGREFHIAVNLSARLLSDRHLQSRVSALLLKHLLEPKLLTLELTETSAITSGEALETLRGLRNLGIRISIDDYGTGLSTLDYLKKVPASELKIDQSFVRGLLDNRSDRVMVQSTIVMAHSLNRTVVAEGVETNELLDALAEMKCDVAQGFIIGRPMSFDSLRRRLVVEQRRSVA
jgi:EAL domain-containing protein (putative c-di-GMP-specific phosphodiesterase class I)